ncbi:MAG: DUF4058 family protein [Gemmataceae bacterium]|nr:DUF4058 family protein [Gemmataceae bacterium]
MPLRDHFRPPVDLKSSWEALHAGWPAVIVQQLKKQLPDGFVAAPGVHRGTQCEVDFESYESDVPLYLSAGEPSVALEILLPDYDEYEVRIYDAKRGRQLVAAIEIVSPANKDRPESRNAFIGKCAAMLQKGVAVSIVDLVTVRQPNLYCELMAFLGQKDPRLCDDPPSIYASSCRWGPRKKRLLLECWSHRLALGQPLPALPIWLGPDLAILLDLEVSYEQACDDLSIA